MEPARFDIYLTGRLADGLDQATAAARLAQLFRSTPEVMANLVTGKPQALKRGVDQATAAKYREALQRAGVEAAVRDAVTPPAPVSAPATGEALTGGDSATGLTLAPIGADVLTTTERRPAVVAEIDTSHLRLESVGGSTSGRAVFGPLDEPAPAATPADRREPDNPFRLDNTHAGAFTLAPADVELLTDAERSQPPLSVPQAPALTLAEPGADLLTATERPPAPPPVTPDISQLRLADS
jgi:hypothetical protein